MNRTVVHIQWPTSASDVPRHEQYVQRRRTEQAVTDFAMPCLHASANHLSELLRCKCSFSMSLFVSCNSFVLPCCRLCMYVLSRTFFFSLPILSSSPFCSIFACNLCTLSPNGYCSLILTFKFATVSFISYCQSNGMCFSCETSLSVACIMPAVKYCCV